jgi:Tol biopolymer transport system component
MTSGRGESGSGLFVVAPGGGKPQKIVAGCIESFAWSPDGKSIALARLVNDYASEDETVVLDVESGRTRLIAKGGRGEPPAWSPDGSEIAFGRYDDGIYVGSSGGSSALKKIPAVGYWPDWSRDGKQIAFDTFSEQVAVANPDGSGVKYLTRPKVTGLGVPVRWLPDGKRLLSAGPETNFAGKDLLAVDVNGGGPTHIAAIAGGTNLYAIAPRSGLIAYSDGTDRIYVVSPDGSAKRRLATGSVGGWSTNGKQLVFADGGLYVINSDGTGIRQVAPRAGVDGIGTVVASWSSRGQIAYIDDSGACGGPS